MITTCFSCKLPLACISYTNGDGWQRTVNACQYCDDKTEYICKTSENCDGSLTITTNTTGLIKIEPHIFEGQESVIFKYEPNEPNR